MVISILLTVLCIVAYYKGQAEITVIAFVALVIHLDLYKIHKVLQKEDKQ